MKRQEYLDRLKALTKTFTDLVTKDSKGKNLIINTKLLSVQFANSNNKSKSIMDEDAIENRLSVIDFSNCEKYLKDYGYLPRNQSIIFSKTDWNSILKSGARKNNTSNVTKSSFVTYDLFTPNGTKINRSLCSETTAKIKIPLKNFNALNVTNLTYDPFNSESPYFNDICKPMNKNETSFTIQDRRNDFKGFNLTCGGGCSSYGKIDTNSGYITCNCKSSSSEAEVTPDFTDLILEVFKQTNFFIIKCYPILLKIVSIFFLNFSLIFS